MFSVVRKRLRVDAENKKSECDICTEEFGLHYALFRCGHLVCTKCADNWLAKKQRCPFCRRRTTSYKDMGRTVVVLPDDEEDIDLINDQPDEEVEYTGWSMITPNGTVLSGYSLLDVQILREIAEFLDRHE